MIITKTNLKVNKSRERGVSMVDYAILLSVIGMVALLGVKLLGQKTSSVFSSAGTAFSITATTQAPAGSGLPNGGTFSDGGNTYTVGGVTYEKQSNGTWKKD